jgi:hypothetical protein
LAALPGLSSALSVFDIGPLATKAKGLTDML